MHELCLSEIESEEGGDPFENSPGMKKIEWMIPDTIVLVMQTFVMAICGLAGLVECNFAGVMVRMDLKNVDVRSLFSIHSGKRVWQGRNQLPRLLDL